MIKQALEYIVGLNDPNYKEYGTMIYTDKDMSPLSFERKIIALETSTLESVIKYIVAQVDSTMRATHRYILHVVDHNKICLYEELNADAYRQCRVIATAETPRLRLNEYIDLETMNIMLQSNFVVTPERDAVLAVIGSVSDGQVIDHQDDGVSQKVTVQAGIRRVGLEEVPNPVQLAPFRTFAEVKQPVSLFVLRMRSGQNQPQAALFEADGGAWKLEARRHIAEYLGRIKKETASEVIILA